MFVCMVSPCETDGVFLSTIIFPHTHTPRRAGESSERASEKKKTLTHMGAVTRAQTQMKRTYAGGPIPMVLTVRGLCGFPTRANVYYLGASHHPYVFCSVSAELKRRQRQQHQPAAAASPSVPVPK